MRVIVGMSGGVDSSLAAALLCQQGHDVIGVTLQLYDYDTTLEETDPSKRHCHPLAFIEDARQVAKNLGIPHHLLSHQYIFQSEIIDPFMESYRQGKTPLPCAKCNRDVKTSALYNMMGEFGADAIATGHYVRRIDVDGQVHIHQGQDLIRDQSFFLFALGIHYFDKMLFPLGAYSKAETRAKAQELGLSVADTPASQDLCFIAKKSYKTLFTATPGDIIHIGDGRILGQHQGVTGFTIGQRQGLGIGGQSESLHVVALDVAKNQVVVGPRHHLACSVIHLDQVNWLAPELLSLRSSVVNPADPSWIQGMNQSKHHQQGGTGNAEAEHRKRKDDGGHCVTDQAEYPSNRDGLESPHGHGVSGNTDHVSAFRNAPHIQDIQVKVRSSSRSVPAKIHLRGDSAIIYLENPDYAISPGQACVFYHGTRLLGGGWISERTRSDALSQKKDT
ncbi:MAG: tRNA 2-thiouridine(34) synthase MnmA [Alphaproteobacteria bacterium]|nr:tRNA 2-thiouridine(34) synthase MnmA [Alphaproteobacteria bacterium]